jgi:hypothetical protein
MEKDWVQEKDLASTRLKDHLKNARVTPVALSVSPCAVSAATASTLPDVRCEQACVSDGRACSG